MKGIKKLREKIPNYPGKRIAILPLRGLLGAIIGYCFMILLDILPRIFPSITFLSVLEPYLPILGSLFVGLFAVWLIRRIWILREKRKAEYGNLAYQKMIPTGVAGVFLVPALIFHAFTSIRSLPPGPPVNELTTLWSQSLLPLIGIPPEIDIILRLFLSSIFILIGILLVRSSIMTFGIDYMTVVYLYFPEESEIQENDIYSVVRHPAYLAGVILGIAALFFRFSVYSIVFCFIVYLVFKLHLRTEEPELIDRFGDGFVEYMERVPAFFVSPRNYRKFFRFLMGK
ncbi:MAG: methyltransferase family protein [Candidatus Thorarchaeota archaeon]|jgi:protein-S-isoprenylcysteine O-methyltransferase Ste14